MQQSIRNVISPTRQLRSIFAACATLALLIGANRAHADDMRFCIDKASPSVAIDADVARAVATQLGARPVLYEYSGQPKGDDPDFDLRAYKGLLAEHCDLVLGFPYDASSGSLPKFLTATPPYAITGFVLVTHKGDPRTKLAKFAAGSKVAVAYNTLPNLYFPHHPNLVREIRADDDDVVAALEHRDVVAAMIWRPGVVGALQRAKAVAKYEFHPLDDAGTSWPLVALHGDKGAEAARRFEHAIAVLRDNGGLAKFLRGYADVAPAATGRRGAEPTGFNHARRHAQGPATSTCAAKSTGKRSVANYTAEQAAAGQQLFEDKCSICHGKNLEGRNGPMLKGKMFFSAEAKHTLGEIFTIVVQNMPATAPATLPHDQYEKIMAYILQVNGFGPTGSALTYEDAKQSKALLVYKDSN